MSLLFCCWLWHDSPVRYVPDELPLEACCGLAAGLNGWKALC